jgi:hypothetical protein
MSTYLQTTDITDVIVYGHTITGYLDRADIEIVNLARERGLQSTQIVTPIDNCIKQWLVAWVTMKFCQEQAGRAQIEVTDMERYYFKYKMYRDEEAKLRNRISASMFLGTATDIRNGSVQSTLLFRS